MNTATATIEVWGDFALWTRPESKVERLSYQVPTPSGIRGLLASIYSKPQEFYWQVRRIEVLRPIRFISFKRNEVKSKLIRIPENDPNRAIICIEDDRTQRQSTVLQDVRYRITAEIVPRPEFSGTVSPLMNQFERRVKRGQNFLQPCMKIVYQLQLTRAINTESIKGYGRKVYEIFSDILDRGIRRGEFRTSLTLEDLTRHFVMAIRGTLYEWCIRYPDFDLKQELLAHCTLFLNGIRGKAE